MKCFFLLFFGCLLLNTGKSIAQFTSVEMEMGRITLDEVSPFLKELDKSGQYLRRASVETQLNAALDKPVSIKKLQVLKKKLTGPEIYKRLAQSTLLLISTSLRATAWVIDESGIIVTNYHVVKNFADTTGKNKEPLLVMSADRHFYVVTEVMAASKINDIAILKVDFKNGKLLPLPLGGSAEEGTEVFVLGNPSHMLYYFTKGIVARNFIRDAANPKIGEDFRMAITADYSLGESGAPIVDSSCNLIGMASAATTLFGDPDQRANPQMVVKSAIPVIAIRQLLK